MTVMPRTRKIEIFSAGCAACEATIAAVRKRACPSCDIVVLNMTEPGVAARAKDLGVRTVPAVVVDGRLAGCCAGRGPDFAVLEAAGLRQPLT
jgi:glutaredoxin 3